MEFNKKLQELRKQKGITQEELAKALFVSRTAISKWESGKGYPNLDSLKAIAQFFSVTIDELLSSKELLTLAEEKTKHFKDLIFGLLDLSIIMFLFLPLFGQTLNEKVQSVSLLSLTQTTPLLLSGYYIIIIGIALYGVLTLALQNCDHSFWVKNKVKTSLFLNLIATLLFIISSQPYAAVLLFVFLIIKALIIRKK